MSRDRQSDRAEAIAALEELDRFSAKLSVPAAAREEAVRIYKRSLQNERFRRKPVTRISASSLYAACRVMEVPTSLREVALVSGVGKVELARCYRLLVDELDLRIPVADPADFLATVTSRTDVGPKVEADARQMLSRVADSGVTSGVFPAALAASALYLASMLDGVRLTQKCAAEAAGVKEATVRKECGRLRKVLGMNAKPRRNCLN